MILSGYLEWEPINKVTRLCGNIKFFFTKNKICGLVHILINQLTVTKFMKNFLDANPCYNSPCENGGSCREYYEGNDAAGKVSFTCGCVEQFEGDRCEIDKCAKCHPYASCDRGRCQCKKNYKGDGETCTKGRKFELPKVTSGVLFGL